MKPDSYTVLGFINPIHDVFDTYSTITNLRPSPPLPSSPVTFSRPANVGPYTQATSSPCAPGWGSPKSTDSCDSFCFSQPSNSQSSVSSIGSSLCEPIKPVDAWQKQPPTQQVQQARARDELPAQLRQNPRRTSTSAVSRAGRPPTLVRQADRKVNFVDNLVDSSTHIVETIWPTSSVVPRDESGNDTVLPLRAFIQETLRRSRTSYSTLQVALYYLILIKPHVPECDFTMEQPDDSHASHALQCGRRMFLAALILASKYLQDRNYSARAWSKISGLDTNEINENEMAFLLAVNWKLHITDDVYNRWTEQVMKHTPSQPPSPGGGSSSTHYFYKRQCDEFRGVIMKLTPELDNLDEICPWATRSNSLSPSRESLSPPAGEAEATPTCRFVESARTPSPPCRQLPALSALGLLPTPRSAGFSTPAAGAPSSGFGRVGFSLGCAMAEASSSYAGVFPLNRRPSSSISPSPQSYFTRRSSLANTISTASSPESMVSDASSRVSRSSSVSSASSTLVNAPAAKLDVQARYRYAKQSSSERWGLRPAIASVPEDDCEENGLTASPDMYMPVNKTSVDLPLPFSGRQHEIDEAARALQALQRYSAKQVADSQVKTGSKRRRSDSTATGNSLQGNVRDLLMSGFQGSEPSWPDALVRRTRTESTRQPQRQIAVPSPGRGCKRVCCSAEAAAEPYGSPLDRAWGRGGRPGMWDGILN